MIPHMAERKGWTHDELLLAMNLYCKLPFGQLRHGNADVIRLASVLNRTPSSVSMKLCNFASFDPALQARGVKGLTGASRADKAVWDEFHADWETLGQQSEALAEEHTPEAPKVLRLDGDDLFHGGEDSFHGGEESRHDGDDLFRGGDHLFRGGNDLFRGGNEKLGLVSE
jgi:hypothetical protein